MTGAADWQGRVGRVWAEEAARTERAFAAIGTALDSVVADVAPDRGRALDIGCGVGSTTVALATARPHLAVTGADLSGDLLALAAARGGGVVDFVHGDALDIAALLAPLNFLVSRHGVMFFADPTAAFTRLRAAVRPGAPFVFSCFRARTDNEWIRAIDAAIGQAPSTEPGHVPGPFAFADRAFVADLLAGSGWHAVRTESLDLSYVVGAGDDPVADALAFFRRIGPAASVLAAARGDERARMEARLAEMLAARTRDGAIAFTAAIWIWHAVAAGESA